MAEELEYQDLKVYKESMTFVEFVDRHLPNPSPSRHAVERLDRASAHLPTHIAKGSLSPQNTRSEQFQQAMNAALECASSLDVLAAQNLIAQDVQSRGKQILKRVISELNELSSGQVEQPPENQPDIRYRSGGETPAHSA